MYRTPVEMCLALAFLALLADLGVRAAPGAALRRAAYPAAATAIVRARAQSLSRLSTTTSRGFEPL